MTTLEEVLSRLHKVRECGEGQYEALCPAHDDSNPSLAISTGDDGRILLHCHAGCSPNDIVRALGLEWSQLFGESSQKQKSNNGKVVETYDYCDESGKLLFQCVRKEPKAFTGLRQDYSEGSFSSSSMRLYMASSSSWMALASSLSILS